MHHYKLLGALQLAAAVLGPAQVHAEVIADRVAKLPGFEGELPTRHWSGYIQVPLKDALNPEGTTANVHYYLVENAAKKPDAPTVVWQQGGPGGSSLIGMFTEMGPLTLNDASYATEGYNKTGVPSVFLNPYSWHNAPANFLFVEHPAPTGFSYCTPRDCVWDDENQAPVNYGFYVKFFALYPELAKNQFYMSGESYAGLLVPTLALQVLKHRTPTNEHLAPWSLSGFALGNDCPGNQIYTCTPYSGWRGAKVALDFRYYHSMISEPLYTKINSVCADWFKGGKPFPSTDGADFDGPTGECRTLLEDPVRPCKSIAGDTYAMGGGYFLYDTCSADLMALHQDGLPHPDDQLALGNPGEASGGYALNNGEYACGQERATQQYLNDKSVQEAMHVKLVGKKAYSFSTGLSYNKTWGSLLDEYKTKLIPNFRIMQYSGDADPCVPFVGTQRWIESLGMGVAAPWRPWRADGPGMIAGYVTVFDVNNFTFATVRDAGHMAPRYKPRQAFHMFSKFLHADPL